MRKPVFLPGSQPPHQLRWARRLAPQDTCQPDASPGVSRSLSPVPLSLLSNGSSEDGSEAKWASVCPLRTGFAHILPLKLAGPWLRLVSKTPYLVGPLEGLKEKDMCETPGLLLPAGGC